VFRDVGTALAGQGKFFQEHIRSFQTMAYFLGVSAASWALMKVSSDGTAASLGKNLGVLAAMWLVMDDITHFQEKQNSLLSDGLSLIKGSYVGAEQLRLGLEGTFETISNFARVAKAIASGDREEVNLLRGELRESLSPNADRARKRLEGGASSQALERGDLKAFLAAEADRRGPAQNEGEQKSRAREFFTQRKKLIEDRPELITNDDRVDFGLAPYTEPSALVQELLPPKPAAAPTTTGAGILGRGVLHVPMLEAAPVLKEVTKTAATTVTNTVTVHMTVNDSQQAAEDLQQKLTRTLRPLIPTAAGQ
jgi:hypothetical protein